MSIEMSDMSGMSGMPMGDGVPGLFYLQKIYWAVIGSAIAAATVVNILNHFLALQRLRDTTLTPSKPKSIIFSSYATITAIFREASYATLPPLSIRGSAFHFAPLGPMAIVLANLVVVLVFCFYKLDTTNQWKWEDVGYRTGFVAIAQLPLIFILAGRQNIIGLLVGMSYERLNWFHRWISRTLWLTATIHMGFWFRNWGRYHYIVYELKNYPMATRGFAAWCILTFIVLTSAAPVRRLGYEFFVLQHLVSFVGFTVAVWLHAPDDVKVWVWIPIGLLVFDRVVRYTWAIYANLSIFYQSNVSKHSIWANRASLTPLPGNVTRIIIENPVVRWKAGQHIFIACHSIAPLQSHPFTISSIENDKKMEFLARAEKGGTRRLFHYASKQDQVLGAGGTKETYTVLIDGPYGTIRPLQQFDSIVLLAGGMGSTFTMPCLRDIVARWKAECQESSARLAATKRIRFIWVIKSRAYISWFESQLQSVLIDVAECQRVRADLTREIDICIYITCDEKLESTTIQPNITCAQNRSKTEATTDADVNDTKQTSEKEDVSIHMTSSSTASNNPTNATGCLPNGGCCCTIQVEDEDQITECKCTCSGPAPTSTPENSVIPEKPTTNAPQLNILSGRPHPQSIIRKVLEKAEGESAVIVCGPQGLSDEVRRSVVYLSDERAVHKGTGAQGVYLHVEKFGW